MRAGGPGNPTPVERKQTGCRGQRGGDSEGWRSSHSSLNLGQWAGSRREGGGEGSIEGLCGSIFTEQVLVLLRAESARNRVLHWDALYLGQCI